MKWVKKFINNSECEIELKTNSFVDVVKVLLDNGWVHKDEFWIPDLQIGLFQQDDKELGVIQETYFEIKMSGRQEVLQVVLNHLKEKGISSY